MKATKYILITAAILMTACNNSDEPATPGDNAVIVTANIGDVASRAAGALWGSGDAIGISTTSTGKTQYANMKYSTTGNGDFTHAGGKATGIFFQSMDPVTFSAYYPFNGTEGTAAGIISCSTADQTRQADFDFLFANNGTASRTAPELSLSFSHRMTRLVLNFQTDTESGFSASEVAGGSFSIGGLKLSGTFNTANGTAAATGPTSESWTINALPTTISDVSTYSLIFFPQTATSLSVTANIAGEEYGCTVTPALNAGTSYIYNITVKKTGLTVGDCTITDWNSVTSGTVSAGMK